MLISFHAGDEVKHPMLPWKQLANIARNESWDKHQANIKTRAKHSTELNFQAMLVL
jgi:hypothetical protein